MPTGEKWDLHPQLLCGVEIGTADKVFFIPEIFKNTLLDFFEKFYEVHKDLWDILKVQQDPWDMRDMLQYLNIVSFMYCI